MADKYKKICTFLKSNNFHYHEGWLKECVEHFIENCPGISENELREQVINQWLLSDLRETAVPAFPPNLSDQAKVVLPGKYIVQVETMVDSGRPRYEQLRQLRKSAWEIENVKATTKRDENAISEKRCITMIITDGVQELRAMEYETLPELKLNDPDLLPGFKMLITGPVTCRRGMILLSRINVKVLGGEVSNLIESNGYEALLMRALGMEGEPQAKMMMPIAAASEEAPADALLDGDDDAFLMDVPLDIDGRNNEEATNGRVTPIESMEGVETFFNDDFDVPDLPDMERNVTNRMEEAWEVAEEINVPSRVEAILDSPEIMYEKAAATSTKQPVQTSLSRYLVPSRQKIHADPFVYLAQICNTDLPYDRLFKIKAHILTLKTKIAVRNDSYALTATICDGSCSADVNFSSDILENMLEFAPGEMIAMKRERKGNKAISEELANKFRIAQQKLINLNCIFCVKFYKDKSVPLVLELEEITFKHLNELRLRVRKN